MKTAQDLLFNVDFSGKTLFRSQLDLVNQLLDTPSSAYYIDNLSQEDINRARGRLKTYISQLLSEATFRNITEDFKRSLALIIKDKLPSNISNDVFNNIIDDLQRKNNALNRKEDAVQHLTNKISLKEDIRMASNVVVISARPIDMNLPIKESEFNIRNWFYDDLIKAMLLGSTNKIKSYRFNFPTKTYCDLFWHGLEKLMVKYLFSLTDEPDYLDFIYNENFTVTTKTLHQYDLYMEKKESLSKDEAILQKIKIIQTISSELIERLNRNKFISVFYNTHPIFSIPVIAINPNESICKVYGILDSEEEKNLVYKFSPENTTLWRIFFWDKLKSSDMGINIPYAENKLGTE